jgi:hypothetical protein
MHDNLRFVDRGDTVDVWDDMYVRHASWIKLPICMQNASPTGRFGPPGRRERSLERTVRSKGKTYRNVRCSNRPLSASRGSLLKGRGAGPDRIRRLSSDSGSLLPKSNGCQWIWMPQLPANVWREHLPPPLYIAPCHRNGYNVTDKCIHRFLRVWKSIDSHILGGRYDFDIIPVGSVSNSPCVFRRKSLLRG